MKASTMNNLDFIAHAFAGCTAHETPWVAGFPGDVATAPHSVWFGAPALPIPQIIGSDRNNYVSVSTFKRNAEGQCRRRKDCWSGLWLVLLDDIGTKIDKRAALRLAPSCMVETSPRNFQAWLFLSAPERNADRAEALINGLIAAGASDPGAGNLTRYGRLPVGINGKAKYADTKGQSWIQRVHAWEPARRYSADEIAAAYGMSLAAARPRVQHSRARADDSQEDRYLPTLEAAGLYLEPLRGMSEAHRIVCPWHQSHTGKDTGGTVYFSPSDENDHRGGFICHHGHCKGRNIADLDHFIARLLSVKAAA